MARQWKFETACCDAIFNYDDRSAAIISKVAKGSPADQLGITKDDYLISIDGSRFTEQEYLDITFTQSTLTYKFLVRSTSTFMEVEIDPIPLGIVADPSSINILKDLKSSGSPGWEAFHILWKRRDWKSLLEASEKVYSSSGISELFRKVAKNFR